MNAPPTFFEFITKGLWPLLSHQSARQLKKMANVRPELMQVVYSRLSDQDAADRLRPIANANQRAARATLKYVAEIRDRHSAYETDRAYRIMLAAVENTAPLPVDAKDAALFERERGLGWLPLEDAFTFLVDLVPELGVLQQNAGALAAGGVPGTTQKHDEAMATDDSFREVRRQALSLVGVDSQNPDALVRSGLAAQVVLKYLEVAAGRPGAPDPTRPVFERPNRRTRTPRRR
jgi:hypothetical protein